MMQPCQATKEEDQAVLMRLEKLCADGNGGELSLSVN